MTRILKLRNQRRGRAGAGVKIFLNFGDSRRTVFLQELQHRQLTAANTLFINIARSLAQMTVNQEKFVEDIFSC